MKKFNKNLRKGNIATNFSITDVDAYAVREYGYDRYGGDVTAVTGNGRLVKMTAWDESCGDCGSRIFIEGQTDKRRFSLSWGSLDSDARLDTEEELEEKLDVLDRFLRLAPGTAWKMVRTAYDCVTMNQYLRSWPEEWDE